MYSKMCYANQIDQTKTKQTDNRPTYFILIKILELCQTDLNIPYIFFLNKLSVKQKSTLKTLQ